jgi:large subunit ribosomal protein L9
MRVILRADVDNVGKKGDVCEVSDGFARNFLLPKGHAFEASKGAVGQAASMRRSRDLKDATERAAAEEIARRLVPAVITVKGRAGTEGRLFGSITTADIVAAVAQQARVELDRRKVLLKDPIKSLGQHSVPVKLHPDVEFVVTLDVVAG